MAFTALILYLLWGALAFGWRTVIQLRRTGDTGFRGSGGQPGSAEWWARLLFVAALTTGLAAPIVDLTGILDPIAMFDSTPVAAAGIALAITGILATVATHLVMGDSWRIGVDPSERTTLVTSGPFHIVRNPIFTAMAATAIGLALIVPNLVAAIGLIALAVALELQVRIVEEPYLLSTHHNSYATYAAKTGRFLPKLGHITKQTEPAGAKSSHHTAANPG